ncbi:MAG: TM0106 family RecB-like putative nuclease [Thermoleophilia bacterium]|nr:TM0106 family RecB-like putative nuclease [Thermoleophilia bacterium]
MRYDPDNRTWRGSATDLANHARCTFLTHQVRERERAYATGELERPEPEQTLAMRKGVEHEERTVAELRAAVEAAGGRFLDLETFGDDHAARRDALHAAMRDGVDLIAQAPLRSGSIFGYADLLERTSDCAPPAGDLTTPHRYRPVEIKFARAPKPAHLLQAAAYADALAQLQGELPDSVDVICGDGTRHASPPSQYTDYFALARERFDAALELPLAPELDRIPEPVPHCETCELRSACDERWQRTDHLSLVARIRADQRTKLVAAGITTLTELATTTIEHVPGIGRATYAQLRTQARLQLDARTAPLPPIEFRRPDPGDPTTRGFALLPDPDPHDIYFDFEGYPYHDSGGLEYLWGWAHHPAADTTAPPAFDFLWADTIVDENAAFTRFLDEVEARRATSAGRMHVYHYAPYEITALRRIARRHPDWMYRLDELLRAGTFVDLYAVVRQSMLIGTGSYSIKKLEQFYAADLRAGAELADGGASIDEYEQYLLTGDPEIRQRIIDYNRDDCISTIDLRDWLLERRADAATQGIEWPTPPTDDPDDEDGNDDPGSDDTPESVQLRQRLEAIADDDDQPDDVRTAARLLAGMPGWGWRIKREFLGELHGMKHERTADDYRLDPNAIGDLELVETLDPPPGARPGTVERIYRFPEQVTLLRAEPGEPQPLAYDPETVVVIGSITSVDHDANTVSVRTTASVRDRAAAALARIGEPAGRIPTSIVGYADIRYGPLESAARRVAQSLLDAIDSGIDPFAPASPHAAALALLARPPPRIGGGAPPRRVDATDPIAVADLTARLDGSHLVIQGPPGTGKTWTSAHLLLELVSRGLRVGISSNSHEAIATVLAKLDELRADRPDVELRAAYAPKRPLGLGDWLVETRTSTIARDAITTGDATILAGTAWTFCDPDLRLDAMLVDEAGQVSLLGATAMAACTSRVLLVGDPQQLPQPSSTSHPHGCDASALELQFGEHAVLPPERALLLPVTRRMHPSIARFISDTYYAGRLSAHPSTSEQLVVVPARPQLPHAGTHLLACEHSGRLIDSPEEVEAIARLVADLLDPAARVVARPGEPERALAPRDIIVVAPYNAQRRALQAALGDSIRVGTVDKFQGKEAAVAIVSMTASSRDELPRGLEFLLDPHRLNVAISRARALAVVVASPALLATDAASLHEMRLLNDLARLARRSAG